MMVVAVRNSDTVSEVGQSLCPLTKARQSYHSVPVPCGGTLLRSPFFALLQLLGEQGKKDFCFKSGEQVNFSLTHHHTPHIIYL